jgi:hypothetical protein
MDYQQNILYKFPIWVGEGAVKKKRLIFLPKFFL